MDAISRGVSHDGQLAAAGGDDLAGHENMVAQDYERLPLRQALFTDVSKREHDLQAHAFALLATFLQGGEAELAGVAHENDAADNANNVFGFFAGFEVFVLVADFLQRVGASYAYRVGFLALGQQLVTLISTYLSLVVWINGLCGIIFGSHNSPFYVS